MPASPVGFKATKTGSTTIKFEIQADNDNTVVFKRGTTEQVVIIAHGATSVEKGGFKPDTQYDFEAAAVDSSGQYSTRVSDGTRTDPAPIDPSGGTPPPPTGETSPIDGYKVPDGKSIPRDKSVVLLECGGTYTLDKWLLNSSRYFSIYGNPSNGKPTIKCNGSTLFDVKSKCQFHHLNLATNVEKATAFDFSFGSILRDIDLIGPGWGSASKLRGGVDGLDIYGFGSKDKVWDYACYDESYGNAKNVKFDLGGKGFVGSRRENLFRIKGVQYFELCNGFVYAPKITDPKPSQKAWLTVQAEPNTSGPRYLKIHDLDVIGPWGLGPIETKAGFQNAPVRDVECWKIRGTSLHDLSFTNGLIGCYIHDCGGEVGPYKVVSTRPVLVAELANPHFPRKVEIKIANFHSTGASKFDDGEVKYLSKVNVTHNNRPV